MNARRLIIIGNGKMAVDCAQIIRRTIATEAPEWRLAFVAVDSSRGVSTEALETFCRGAGLDFACVPKINAPEFRDRLRAMDLELIFSINNFQLLKESLLALPARGVINFHNAPLPKYAGSNACTWAIFHGESYHGVTWHQVDAGIDSGDIIAQAHFPVPENCTAIRLIMACLVEGARLFEKTLPAMLAGDAPRRPQDRHSRTFFPMRQLPDEGRMPIDAEFDTLSRFVRSLNFHPFCNELAFPSLACGGRSFRVDEIALVARERRGKIGEVLELTDRVCHVQCADAVLSIVKFRDVSGRALKFQDLALHYDLRLGALLVGSGSECAPPPCSPPI